tara:strand:+ start:1698 stop:1985 length:288 start_codon:yes stop_codon:yes gene_type:complete
MSDRIINIVDKKLLDQHRDEYLNSKDFQEALIVFVAKKINNREYHRVYYHNNKKKVKQYYKKKYLGSRNLKPPPPPFKLDVRHAEKGKAFEIDFS